VPSAASLRHPVRPSGHGIGMAVHRRRQPAWRRHGQAALGLPRGAPIGIELVQDMALIGRFRHAQRVFFGAVEGDRVRPLRGEVFRNPQASRKTLKLSELIVLPPVQPSKLIAVGLNYRDHAAEMGLTPPVEPLFWFKAPSSLLAHGGRIRVPYPGHRTDYEAELAIVIGRTARNVSAAAARRCIWGYTAAQDISDRTIQRSESQWGRAKSFDTFTPLGPWVDTEMDPAALSIELFQNGVRRQSSNTRELVFDCHAVVGHVSKHLTLVPGDVILTGTPGGVGPIQSGDRLEVRIEGLGPLRNTVR